MKPTPLFQCLPGSCLGGRWNQAEVWAWHRVSDCAFQTQYLCQFGNPKLNAECLIHCYNLEVMCHYKWDLFGAAGALVFLKISRTASPRVWPKPWPQTADLSLILCWQEFLQDKHLFHGDVAARNVLIQCDLTAKLCGLGLAYEVHTQGAISSTRTIPLKWLAPERLLLRPASISGDMYSLFLCFGSLPFGRRCPLVSDCDSVCCQLCLWMKSLLRLSSRNVYYVTELIFGIWLQSFLVTFEVFRLS